MCGIIGIASNKLVSTNIIQSLVFLIQVLLFLSMDSLIVKSPFLVGMVAVLGGIREILTLLDF